MSALVQYEPFVDNTTKLFLKQTEKLFVNKSEPCDFTQWLQFYAFDVIGEITYSKRHGFIEHNKDVDGIVEYLSWLFLYVAPVSQPLLPLSPLNDNLTWNLQIGQMPLLDLLFLKNPIYLKLAQWGIVDATMPVARFARNRMAERLPELTGEKSPSSILPTTAVNVKSPDLLSKFLAAREARPEFMTDTLVQTMAVSMAFAGSETTAISLSAVFYYLLKNPVCLARLREEIDDAGRKGLFSDLETGLVTWTESQKLPYLDACVKEAFRLHPAAGLPLERIVPEPGVEICGTWVKGGTIVGCSAWIIHMNKEVFGEDVEVYRPERWLVDENKNKEEEERRIKEMNGTMFQFGMGSRTCIGKNISLLEVYKLVPSMLRRFEVSFLSLARWRW
jgi:hypothetical protein